MEEDDLSSKTIPRWVELEYKVCIVLTSTSKIGKMLIKLPIPSICKISQVPDPKSTSLIFPNVPAKHSNHFSPPRHTPYHPYQQTMQRQAQKPRVTLMQKVF